jgi:hypothetical protein
VYCGDLRAGRAAVKITPPHGMVMRGDFVIGLESVHDDIHAKALVLEKDGTKAALVVCDLIGVPRPVIEEARQIIAKTAGIPGNHVMISATHTHTGPLLNRGRSSSPGQASGERAPAINAYTASLPGKIAESVRLAAADLAPVKISAWIGQEDSLPFNRRFLMKDGTVRFNPGKLNPAIVRTMGPVDPAVAVVYVESADGRPRATYVNYPMHLDTVGGNQISSDYPHTLAAILSKVKGPDMLTVFSAGTAGNINHVDVTNRARQKGHEEAARIGTVLAGEVIKSYTRLKPVSGEMLQVRHEIVKMPLWELKPDDVEKARAAMEQARKTGKPLAFIDRVYHGKILDVASREGKPIDAEVQVIALGDQIAWVGLPGEIFVELGLAIKEASLFPYTIVASLANDAIGYVPNRDAYPQGAYEVLNARGGPGSGELLVDAAMRMLREMYPAKAATR